MAGRQLSNVQHLHGLHFLGLFHGALVREQEVTAGGRGQWCPGDRGDRTDQVVFQTTVAIAFADLVVAILVHEFAVLPDAGFDFLIDVAIQWRWTLVV